MTDLRRLGKPGAYRLGQLRARGVGQAPPPEPFRPSFARPRHRGPLWPWILGWLAGTALILAGAVAGWWFMPFIIGLLAGLVTRPGGWRLAAALPAAAAMALAGWGLALWWPALHGQPSGATARVIAALAGLPAYAGVGVAAALLVAVLQMLAGTWLGRALAPHPPT
ncbi:MAG: hypothetical protein ACLPUO_08900 [Streptosporangiaceae bacterium]|jgi:GNAT superfamily N-acetyltransferase